MTPCTHCHAEDFLTVYFGAELTAKILSKAGLDEVPRGKSFSSTQAELPPEALGGPGVKAARNWTSACPYNDCHIYNLMEAAAEVLSMSSFDIGRRYGNHFVKVSPGWLCMCEREV
jgi:hypothetical protein